MNALLLSIFGLLAALVLIRYGMKRTLIPEGELRCSKCEYLLIGIDSEHCPECGTPTASAIRGSLPRRWRLIVLGLSIAMISIDGVAGNWYRPFQTDTWYHLAPARVLLWQQQFPSHNDSCWRELLSRAASRHLSPAQETQVAGTAMMELRSIRAREAARGYTGNSDPALDCLLYLAGVGKLNPRQANKVCDMMVHLLTAETYNAAFPMIDGRSIYCLRNTRLRNLWCTVSVGWFVDGQPKSEGHRVRDDHLSWSPTVHAGVFDIQLSTPPPGRHTLKAGYTFNFYLGFEGNTAHSRKIGRCTRTATTQFVVPTPSGQ